MLILFLATVCLTLMLPLLPALTEVRRRRDAAPLPVSEDYEEDLQRAARYFESMLWQSMSEMQDLRPLTPAQAKADGTPPPFYLLWHEEDLTLLRREHPAAPYLFAPSRPWLLPAGLHFGGEVFAAQALTAGPDTSFVALWGEQDLHLGSNTRVDRWLHGRADVEVEAGSMLSGSTSAEGVLRVGADCRFERLHAPLIVFGSTEGGEVEELRVTSIPEQQDLSLGEEAEGHRVVVNGDLDVSAHQQLTGNFIITGSLRIREGAHVTGSFKVHGDVVLEPQACIKGHLFGRRNLTFGAGSLVVGAVMAEGRLTVAQGCQFGTPAHPTTVNAYELIVAEGVRAYGTVWAQAIGRTEPTERRRPLQARLEGLRQRSTATADRPAVPKASRRLRWRMPRRKPSA